MNKPKKDLMLIQEIHVLILSITMSTTVKIKMVMKMDLMQQKINNSIINKINSIKT